jgi:hypothetical protein
LKNVKSLIKKGALSGCQYDKVMLKAWIYRGNPTKLAPMPNPAPVRAVTPMLGM